MDNKIIFGGRGDFVFWILISVFFIVVGIILVLHPYSFNFDLIGYILRGEAATLFQPKNDWMYSVIGGGIVLMGVYSLASIQTIAIVIDPLRRLLEVRHSHFFVTKKTVYYFSDIESVEIRKEKGGGDADVVKQGLSFPMFIRTTSGQEIDLDRGRRSYSFFVTKPSIKREELAYKLADIIGASYIKLWS